MQNSISGQGLECICSAMISDGDPTSCHVLHSDPTRIGSRRDFQVSVPWKKEYIPFAANRIS